MYKANRHRNCGTTAADTMAALLLLLINNNIQLLIIINNSVDLLWSILHLYLDSTAIQTQKNDN